MSETPRHIRVLAAALSRKDRSGAPVYTKDDTRHVLTFLVIAGVVDPSGIPQSGRDDVARVFEDATVENTDQNDAIRTKLASYYARHPPNRALLQEIVAGLATVTEQAQTARLEKAAHALSGAGPVDWNGFLGESQATEIRSGPLAQILLAKSGRPK